MPKDKEGPRVLGDADGFLRTTVSSEQKQVAPTPKKPHWAETLFVGGILIVGIGLGFYVLHKLVFAIPL